jgi:hypothetical protein
VTGGWQYVSHQGHAEEAWTTAGSNHETLAWATENARELLKEENDRIQALDAKAGQLAGFSGVILAVLGSIATDSFDKNLGAVGDPVFAAMYFASVGALTAAILWLVFFALKPQRFIAINARELTAYLEDDRLLRAQPWALQIRTLRALRDCTLWAQQGAEQKANRLTTGVVIFAVGLAAALAAVVALGLGTLN